jgi:hypothetical protein
MTTEPPEENDNEGRYLDLLQGGDQEHLALALPAASPVLTQIAEALSLLAEGLVNASPKENEPLAPNVVAGITCLASAFRGIRAATLLALNGYATEARTIIRRTYEAAALSRMLAREPRLAEKWLRKGEWFPDREVRSWFGVQAAPDEERTGYQEYYKYASAYAHPSYRSTRSLLPEGNLVLETAAEPTESLLVLREINAVGVFSCFAFRNGAVDPTFIPPRWHRELAELAEAVGFDLPHLQQDWEASQESFNRFMDAVIPADELEEHFTSHPNSYINVRTRANERSDEQPS